MGQGRDDGSKSTVEREKRERREGSIIASADEKCKSSHDTEQKSPMRNSHQRSMIGLERHGGSYWGGGLKFLARS